jgi:CRISP-associated protein Cas1
MQLIIDTANTTLSVKNKGFFICNPSTQRIISPARVRSIAITTNCSLNVAAIKLAATNQVPIYIFDALGQIQARLWSPYFTNTAELRKLQLKFYDTAAATTWVIELLKRKTTLQIQNLHRIARGKDSMLQMFDADTKLMIENVRKLESLYLLQIDECRSSILGIEGNISKLYFKNLSALLPDPFIFNKRSRQPALDYFNAGLNYLYGMTYSVVENGVFAKGLDPFAGYLHTDNYLKTSLVFDLIEPVRPLIDRLLAEMCLDGLLSSAHFEQKAPGYWLGKSGKRVIIPAFNDYMNKRIKVNDRVMRVKDHIFNESFHLGRIISQHFNKGTE